MTAPRDWDDEYAIGGRLWGDEPTLLARRAVDLLAGETRRLRVLDVGCGYGRDSLFLARTLRCDVLGVDASPAVVDEAKAAARKLDRGTAEFVTGDFDEVSESGFDAVFAANLYQVLRDRDRVRFRAAVQRWLAPGGLLLLLTLSVSDRQEYGKGEEVLSESDSFTGEKFLHFSRESELHADFAFLASVVASEVAYDEPHLRGDTHHHTAWLLSGRMP